MTTTITKDAGLDAWGEMTAGAATTYSCRITEKVEIVRDVRGQEVVSKASLLFKGFVDVGYTDTISWTVEGQTRNEKPLAISYKRDLGGNILFTKVAV